MQHALLSEISCFWKELCYFNHLKIFDTARCQEELKSLLAEAKSQKAKASEHQRWGPLTTTDRWRWRLDKLSTCLFVGLLARRLAHDSFYKKSLKLEEQNRMHDKYYSTFLGFGIVAAKNIFYGKSWSA